MPVHYIHLLKLNEFNKIKVLRLKFVKILSRRILSGLYFKFPPFLINENGNCKKEPAKTMSPGDSNLRASSSEVGTYIALLHVVKQDLRYAGRNA